MPETLETVRKPAEAPESQEVMTAPAGTTITVAPRRRSVRIGLLGLGNVGQAVVSLLRSSRPLLGALGLDVHCTTALVRDVTRPRRTGTAASTTQDPEALFASDPDLIIETLGGVEPARALVDRALRSGIGVVTANKTLIAVHGEELLRVAAQHNAALRDESSVIAGGVFLGSLRRRPFATRVERIAGIFNGTSNFVLSEMEQRGRSFSEALRAAQELGLAEPDAQRDVSGLDAADKLAIVLRELGASGVRPGAIETRGIEGLDPGDLAQACELGGRIRPLVWASRGPTGLEACVGPTWLASDHPLAAVRGADNAIQLRGRQIGNLLYSGPGAGPEVTAATILDDVVEAVAGASTESGAVNAGGPSAAVAELEHAAGTLPYGRRCAQVVSPATPWFVRLRFGESAPAFGDLCSLLGSYAIWFRQTRWGRTAGRAQALYGLTGRCSRSRLEAALRVVEDATGGRSFACRALEDERCR